MAAVDGAQLEPLLRAVREAEAVLWDVLGEAGAPRHLAGRAAAARIDLLVYRDRIEKQMAGVVIEEEVTTQIARTTEEERLFLVNGVLRNLGFPELGKEPQPRKRASWWRLAGRSASGAA